MNFEFDEDQTMIEAMVERFVSDRYPAGVREMTTKLRADENWSLLAELGILSGLFSAEEGGLGGGPVEIMILLRAMGRGLSTDPVLEQALLPGKILAAAGSETQKADWLLPLMSGERRLGTALVERCGRWSPALVETHIVGSHVHGIKSFATGEVDGWIVSALHNGEPVLGLVRADADGVTQRHYRRVDGAVAAEVSFDGAAVEILPGDLRSIDGALDLARLGASAEMIGLVDRVFEATLDYVRTRRQFGAAIGSFQAIQHRLADLYGKIELARSQMLRAATATSDASPRAIAAAKAHVSEVAVRVAEESIQLHGGMGASDELDIGAALKRILVLSTLLGDAEHEVRRYNTLMRMAG